MHYIKDIFEKKDSEHAHSKFIRYSKGEFVGPLMTIKFQKNKVRVNGSFHLVDELLKIVADKLGNQTVAAKGSLVWNQDLESLFNKLGVQYEKVTKSRGIFKYVLNNEIQLKDFVEEFSSYKLLLSFKTPDISYTCKKAFPNPNKEFGDDFCKVILPIEMADLIKQEFLFDLEEDVKQVQVRHKLDINDIILPEVDDFALARKLAKRTGTITRTLIIGDETKESQIDFKV